MNSTKYENLNKRLKEIENGTLFMSAQQKAIFLMNVEKNNTWGKETVALYRNIQREKENQAFDLKF